MAHASSVPASEQRGRERNARAEWDCEALFPFPDNPADRSSDGVSNVRASLQRTLARKQPDTMAVQKYDIRTPAGRIA